MGIDLSGFFDSIKGFIKLLEEQGIKLLWVHDPVNGERPSVSLTLLVFASIFLGLAIISGHYECLKGIDKELAFNSWMACASLYFLRKISIGNKSASTEKEKE